MTSYHGGKQRIGLRIAKQIHSIHENKHKSIGYCEPFCGMLGVYQHIPDLFNQKMSYLAGDTNDSVIRMWKRAQKKWKPPTTCTKDEYDRLKVSSSSALKGYIGHQYSFGGQYFMGYAPLYGKTVDSSKASTKVVSIAKKLSTATFSTGSYTQYSNLSNFIIYCDPPYQNTSQRYKVMDGFDSEEFWDWCRMMSKKNIIFVSCYIAPNDFTEVASFSHKLTGIIHSNADKNRTEKLYYLVGYKYI